MRLSQSFLPVLKESPAGAEVASHKLMLQAGLIRQTSSGIYAWLPLGNRVLRKIEQIVREEQDRVGQEILMPTIQPADLWKESGRYDAYGPEMLRINDRHGREMLYGPTNEDMVTALFRDDVKSYRELPRMLYHIQWKFRDEVRPRFGVMRGREFLMKDAYSFDLDEAGAKISYYRQLLAYLRTFRRMGIRAVPMQADSGPIGGKLSHEFVVLAPSGESEVFYDGKIEEVDLEREGLSYDDAEALEALFREATGVYARTDETHEERYWDAVPAERQRTGRGIEVGHIFYFGIRYSEAMGLKVSGPDGTMLVPHMGSYGIGVSRLVGAIIEASHDDNGIVWPEAVAPYKVGIVTMRADDADTVAAAERIYAALGEAGVEALYDDRDERGGVKLGGMDLMGLPWQVVIGPRGLKDGVVEVKNRKSGEREQLTIEDAIAKLSA
ncbi:proline--tRNA ligase [Sphingomicrobium astaxanthinifaciens]|uniref:proline--tRNA ligase n=1 Tax=Sphingomicrobium astaxanthinifaciens TaxID=1227949 RepID=UPI001FCC8A38|nr:proline--tRNA ligase [Sphingomicrobium astaxanthinifaciens]MCJ7420240.1 proline--tRNA ligase [Sphingomicrobium astaxanthinifaciens]